MKLGDFFRSAAHARPINPKPIQFTACTRNPILPGGAPSSHPGKIIAARISAAFVFIDANEVSDARMQARAALRERYKEAKSGLPLPTDESDFNVEFIYQQLARAIYEYDERDRSVGERMFPDAHALRELVQLLEASRLIRLYDDYVAEEHPEVVDDATFRGAETGS